MLRLDFSHFAECGERGRDGELLRSAVVGSEQFAGERIQSLHLQGEHSAISLESMRNIILVVCCISTAARLTIVL